MSGVYHTIGHRVASVSFTRGEAVCDCGAVVAVPDVAASRSEVRT